MQPTGAYAADRASALSGVPKSTVHYWAREGVLVPSVSTSRVKLWSYADLMGLRIIYWLRQTKTQAAGAEIPRTGMKAIRGALTRLRELGEPLWHPDDTSIWIHADGEIAVKGPAGPETLQGQQLLPEAINLIAPFPTREGLNGPDLARPRPDLRIVPGRLSGAPHIARTRLETRAVAALAEDGLAIELIQQLYPFASHDHIVQALDLERQLRDNLAIHVAAA